MGVWAIAPVSARGLCVSSVRRRSNATRAQKGSRMLWRSEEWERREAEGKARARPCMGAALRGEVVRGRVRVVRFRRSGQTRSKPARSSRSSRPTEAAKLLVGSGQTARSLTPSRSAADTGLPDRSDQIASCSGQVARSPQSHARRKLLRSTNHPYSSCRNMKKL